jgi:hypothetical protein
MATVRRSTVIMQVPMHDILVTGSFDVVILGGQAT